MSWSPRGVQYPENARDQLAGEGSPAADALPDAPTSSYYGPPDTRDHWSWRTLGIWVGILIAIVAIVGAILFAVPFSHSFSGVAVPFNGDQPYLIFPAGAPVNLRWQSDTGAPVTFQVVPASTLSPLYSVTAVSGSFSFTSGQQGYYFCTFPISAGSANFTGSYQWPLYPATTR